VCTSLCLKVHRGHYNIPQNMVFPTVIVVVDLGVMHATCVMERNFAVSSISMYTPVSSIVLRVFGWLVGWLVGWLRVHIPQPFLQMVLIKNPFLRIK